MPRHQGLDAAYVVMEKRQKLAAKSFAHSQKVLHQAQQQLEDLLNYKKEYQNGFTLDGKNGMDGARLQGYHAFKRQLERGIEQQKQVIDNARQHCESQRKQWLMSYQKVKAVENLQRRQRLQAQKETDRKEQKLNDEQSMRKNNTESDT